MNDSAGILKNMRIGIIIINKRTHIIEYVNEVAAEFSKTTPGAITGKKCRGLICSAAGGNCPIPGDVPLTGLERPALRSDGTVINIVKTFSSIDFNGSPCVIETFIDITEIREFSHLLERDKEQLHLAMSIADEGIWEYDCGNDAFRFDENLYTMTGYDNNEFPAELDSWLERIHPDDWRETRGKLREFHRGNGENYRSEYKFLHKRGHYFWIRTIGEVIERNDKGEPSRLLCIHMDISEEKKREKRNHLRNSLQMQLLKPSSLKDKALQITKTAVLSIEASLARIWILGDKDRCEAGCPHRESDQYGRYCHKATQCLHLIASSSDSDIFSRSPDRNPAGQYGIGRVLLETEDKIVSNDLASEKPGVENLWIQNHGMRSFGGFKLKDPQGSRIGVLSILSRNKIGGEIESFLESLSSLTSQIIINDRAENALIKALSESERANILMNGREARIRQIKDEVNALLDELGRNRKYGLSDHSATGGSLMPEDEKRNALSLAEDAELARRQLAESNEQLSLIREAVNSSSDAVAISDMKGDFFFINQTFSGLFGVSLFDLAMAPPEDLFEDRNIYGLSMEKARSGQSFQRETDMLPRGKKKLPVFLRSSPIRDGKNTLIGIIWNVTDISRRKENEYRIQKDLEQKREMLRKAHLLQQSYIQKIIPSVQNFNIQGLFMPCEKLGGDLFKIIKGIQEKKLIVVMGDCTDHGLKSSLDASLLSSIIESHISRFFTEGKPDLFLSRVSRDFMNVADEDQYPTMTAMVIDLTQGLLRYSNANGELPYLYRDGVLKMMEKAEGMHIGYFDDPAYESREIQLQSGDRIILYSDAVVEIPAVGGRLENRRTFEELLRKSEGNSSKCFYEIVRQLERLNGGFPLEDDTTLIQMEYIESEHYSFAFNHIDEWTEELAHFKEKMRRFDYGIDEREKTAIAVTELSINAFSHGNMSDITKTVNISGYLNCRQIVLSIEDEGSGFDPESVPDPVKDISGIMRRDIEDEYTHGRGLRIARDFLTELKWNRIGNKVSLIQEKKNREIITIEKISF